MTAHWKPAKLAPIPLVFTDLDGTLLDHDNYSHEAAQPALAKLEKHKIPVIPVTSKTCAELLELRQELNNTHPFIVENGAAIYIPSDYFGLSHDQQILDLFENFTVTSSVDKNLLVYTLGKPRQHWIDLLAALDPHLQTAFTGFNTLGVDGIARHTQLPQARASLANQRAASEPLLWQGNDDQLDQLRQQVSNGGGQTLRGGRFVHVLDHSASKGAAVDWLTRLYQMAYPDKLFTRIALGDAENDLSMLERADWPILIRNSHRPAPPCTQHIKNVLHSQSNGPQGWNEMVLAVLDELSENYWTL